MLQNPAHAVIRIALTAGASPTRDRSFVEDMVRAAAKGMKLTLFTDEFRCPIAAGALARALWEFARSTDRAFIIWGVASDCHAGDRRIAGALVSGTRVYYSTGLGGGATRAYLVHLICPCAATKFKRSCHSACLGCASG